jgi:hypothetical protein
MGLWQRFGRFGFMDLVDKGGLDEKRAGRVAMLVIILLYKVIPNHATQFDWVWRSLLRSCYFLRSFTNSSDRNTKQHRAVPALKSAKHALKSKASFPKLLPVRTEWL